MARARNVLFIVLDQLRADCVFGDLAAHIDIPNLRALMDDAVTFQNHYSVASPCGPARASLLTGQYPMNHRAVRNGTPLRAGIPSIASEIRKAGYLPMLFGYTDTAQDPRGVDPRDPSVRTYEYPMAGFHEALEMRFEMSYPWRSHLINQGYEFADYAEVYRPVAPDGGSPKINDPALYRAEDSDTAFLTDRFLDTMPAYKGQSWFAHLTYIRPHPPLVAPAPFNTLYDPAHIPMPKRLATPAEEVESHPFFAPTLAARTVAGHVVGFPDLQPTDETVQTLRTLYFGLITEVDKHIERIISFLKKSGQYDETLIIVTADHGEMLGDRHCWGKSTVHDAAYHVPLIIRDPDNAARAGAVVSLPTESIDVTPTVLAWCEQAIPNSVDGRSLLPLVRGDAPQNWRTHTVSEFDFSEPEAPTRWEIALRTGPSNSALMILREAPFTLVEFAADLPPILYDHGGQGEAKNVAADAAYRDTLSRLTRAMLRHRMRYMDHTLSLVTITEEGPRETLRHPGS